MLEKEIERLLVKGIKELGGVAYKFVSPGNSGVPDRLVVLPGGRVIFAELKTDKGKPTVLQIQQMTRLHEMGCDVRLLSGKDQVSNFLAELKER